MIRPLSDEGGHGFGEADIVEGGGSEFPREEIHVRIESLCNRFRLFQFLAYFPVSPEALIERGEIKSQCSHLLAHLVVYIARDAASLIFLRAHDLAEQPNSISFGLYALGDFIAQRFIEFRQLERALAHPHLQLLICAPT